MNRVCEDEQMTTGWCGRSIKGKDHSLKLCGVLRTLASLSEAKCMLLCY